MALGIDTVQTGSDHCDRRQALRIGADAVERPFVRAAVDAQRHTRHHRHTGLAELARKQACVGSPLRGRIAAADDGDAVGKTAMEHRRRRCRGCPIRAKARVADPIQQQRRVGNIQQRRRIVRVAQRDDGSAGRQRIFVARLREPVPGRVQLRLQAHGRQAQCGRLRGVDDLRQRGGRLQKDPGRQAKGTQKLARRGVANARRHRQSEPVGDFFALHGWRGRLQVPLAGYRPVNAGWPGGRRP